MYCRPSRPTGVFRALNYARPDNVFLAVKHVDIRRGIGPLTPYKLVELKSTWREGAAFVIVYIARSRIKVLRWDKHEVRLCAGSQPTRCVVDAVGVLFFLLVISGW